MNNNGEWRRSRQDRRVEWARLDPAEPGGIHLPKRDGDVGWDLEAMCDVAIPPMTAVDVPVNARVALPGGIWAEIRARSSIARRNLQVDSGVLDTGYRGPLYVLLRNMNLPQMRALNDDQLRGALGMAGVPGASGLVVPGAPPLDVSNMANVVVAGPDADPGTVVIQKGERVGQLIFHLVAAVWTVEVEQVDTATERAEAGFGSTGR